MLMQVEGQSVARLFVAVALLIGILCLAGCDDPQSCPPPPVQVKTVTVDRLVPVPCANAADIPAATPMLSDQATGDAAADLDLALAELIPLRADNAEMRAMLSACTK